MFWLLWLFCVIGGLVVYFAIVRPFLIPLSWRIPNGREYRPTFGARR